MKTSEVIFAKLQNRIHSENFKNTLRLSKKAFTNCIFNILNTSLRLFCNFCDFCVYFIDLYIEIEENCF